MINTAIGLLFLATFIEGFIEYVFTATDIDPNSWVYRFQVKKYLPLVIGIAVCIGYAIDIPAMLGLTTGIAIVGQIISGIIIGRGSNYLNDVLSLTERNNVTTVSSSTPVETTVTTNPIG